MARYRNALMRELGAQLVRGPNSLKWKQTLGAEKLYQILLPDRDYPYEIITDYLTGFRDRNPRVHRPLVSGRELMRDLPALIDEVSESGPLAAEGSPQPLMTSEDVAQKFGVSTKTVNRWRADGLVGRKVRFADGRTRTAFLVSSVEHFVGAHGDRVRRGKQFSRLSPDERSAVMRRARRMAPHGSRSEVIERIARRMGRSTETIRYVLSEWDQENPTRALFPDRRRTFSAQQYQEIYDAHRAGRAPADLASKFGCAASTIYRAICQVRFEELRKQKPQFLANRSFTQPGAEETILRRPIPESAPAEGHGAPDGAMPYLRDLWGAEVLTSEQEQALFRRYNFLKFLAARDIERMESHGLLSGRRLNDIAGWLAWAGKVRERLIRANLRLVVSIARKHHGPMTQLADLISDGNVVLMRAIEKFDFSRGQKFSTYCSWAVMKHFARSIPEANYHHRWVLPAEAELWQQVSSDARLAAYRRPGLDRVRAGLEDGLAVLPPRERDVLVNHYGLCDGGRGKTFTEIGRRLGVTKERVRQIEAAALKRLRRLLGADVLDQLATM